MVRQTGAERVRVFRRAAVAWHEHKPHRAWEILAASGYGDHWNEFLRTALVRARRTAVSRGVAR
jgi:hypothetical protein